MSSKRIRKKRLKQNGLYLRCVLCGQPLDGQKGNFVSGRHGQVCHHCLQTSAVLAEPQKEENRAEQLEHLTPQMLMAQLDASIVGQEQAKRAVALAMWKQRLQADGRTNVPTGHLLLYGPSGCGKTYLATQAAKLCGLPYLVFDATSLTEAGYKGRDAAEIFKSYEAANRGHPNLKHGVIILDEIDKLTGTGSAERQAHFRGTQHTLLKQMEREDGILLLLCGAFHGLSEADRRPAIGFVQPEQTTPIQALSEVFVAYGMERELMGRISTYVSLAALTEQDLLALLQKQDSVLAQYQAFFSGFGIDLVLPEAEAVEFARHALQQGTGARGMKRELDRCMEPLLLELAAGPTKKQMEVRYVHAEVV